MGSEFSTDSSDPRGPLEIMKDTETEFGMSLLASTLAHEIRNPLQSIRLQLDAAQRGTRVQKSLQSISENVARLETVVEKVQKLSQKYEVDPEKMNLRSLVDSTLELVSFWLSASGIRVTSHVNWEGEPWVEADRELLQQVLLNLFMNAIQAMPEGGDLKVEIAEELESAVIEIVDTGVGISSGDLKHVGTPFFTTKSNGSGLGLAFCKTIARLHGGGIEFESHPNEGTHVTLRISKSPTSGRTTEENANVQ